VPIGAVVLHGSWREVEAEPKAKTARGVVFYDANHNRKFDAGEKPLPKVKVSNGRDIVLTDKDGKYALPVGDDTIIFVIQPSGYRVPMSIVQGLLDPQPPGDTPRV